MEKEFVPYEQALLLKELGFDEPCLGYWFTNPQKKYIPEICQGSWNNMTSQENIKTLYYGISGPTFSQAFRWFREKYEYEISIHKLIEEDGYMASIGWEGVKDIMEQVEGTTYEEAELFCLQQMIILCKQN